MDRYTGRMVKRLMQEEIDACIEYLDNGACLYHPFIDPPDEVDYIVRRALEIAKCGFDG